MEQYLCFLVADLSLAIPVDQVAEVAPVPPITKIPRPAPHIEGLATLRGKAIPVVDLRKRFGLVNPVTDRHTRVIVVLAGSRSEPVGFIVDSVSEVLRISDSTVEPPPALVAGVESDYIEGVGKLDNRLLILLELKKIFSASDRKELEKATNN